MIDDRLGVLRRGAVLLFAALLVQVVMAELEAFGAVADVMLLLPLAAGSLAGPDRGASFGFASGLLYDLVVPDTPLGLSALVYAVVGYAAGAAAGLVLQPRWWFHEALAVVGSVVALALMVVIDQMLGGRYPLDNVLRFVAVVAVWNALLILPVRRLVAWVLGLGRDQYDFALVP